MWEQDADSSEHTVHVTVGFLTHYPLLGGCDYFCVMNLFTPSKAGNRGPEPAVGSAPASQDNTELAELVCRQARELEGLRGRLENAELASPKTPRLPAEALAEFPVRDTPAGWMKQTAKALDQ